MNQEILTLRKGSLELQKLLLTGEVVHYGETWIGVPREVIWTGLSQEGLESVVFEIFHPKSVQRPNIGKMIWQTIRFKSLTLSFTPCLTVLAYGTSIGWEPNWMQATLALLGVLFLQFSVNAFNDVEDHLRLIDLSGTLRSGGVIQKGWMSAKRLRSFAWGSLILGILCGLPAVFQGPRELLWIAAAATSGVLAHSNRPFGMKYRTFGDLGIFLLLGPCLSLGYSQAVFDQTDRMVWGLGLFFGALAWGSFMTRQLQSFELDRSRKTPTLAQLLGFKKSRHLLTGFYLLGFFCLWLSIGSQVSHSLSFSEAVFLILATGISMPWAVRLLKRVYRASGPISALLTPIRQEALQIHLLTGVGLGLALGILKFLK